MLDGAVVLVAANSRCAMVQNERMASTMRAPNEPSSWYSLSETLMASSLEDDDEDDDDDEGALDMELSDDATWLGSATAESDCR